MIHDRVKYYLNHLSKNLEACQLLFHLKLKSTTNSIHTKALSSFNCKNLLFLFYLIFYSICL
jgi:hypothetical protein